MKYIKPILLCIICGFSMGIFLYSSYEKKAVIKPVFENKEKIYFLKVGTYKTENEMVQSLKNTSNYIYRIKDNNYIAYLAMTSKSENIEKIKGYFKKIGYIVSEEEIYIDNSNFIEILSTYDEMLVNTQDDKVIENIIIGVINKYKETFNE